MAEDKQVVEEVVEVAKTGAEVKVAKRAAKAVEADTSAQVKQSGVKVSGPKG